VKSQRGSLLLFWFLKKFLKTGIISQVFDIFWYLGSILKEYGNTGCGVFKQGYKIRKIFELESTYPKEII